MLRRALVILYVASAACFPWGGLPKGLAMIRGGYQSRAAVVMSTASREPQLTPVATPIVAAALLAAATAVTSASDSGLPSSPAAAPSLYERLPSTTAFDVQDSSDFDRLLELMPFDEDMSVRQDRIFGVDFGHANGNSIAGLESDLDRLG